MILCSPIDFQNKRFLFIAPHPDDDVIGCGALLLSLSKQKQVSIHVAYAVSGYRGVTDRFLQKTFEKNSQDKSQVLKSELRRNEALACCDYLGATAHFWNLPFYEADKKDFSDYDVSIVQNSIKKLNPDVIVMIDESGDPHGTHGLIREICLKAAQMDKRTLRPVILGYRVWADGYKKHECDVVLSFGHELMAEKKRLIKNHASQISDPAFPHEHHSFVELAEKRDHQAALHVGSVLSYVECYRQIK